MSVGAGDGDTVVTWAVGLIELVGDEVPEHHDGGLEEFAQTIDFIQSNFQNETE